MKRMLSLDSKKTKKDKINFINFKIFAMRIELFLFFMNLVL